MEEFKLIKVDRKKGLCSQCCFSPINCLKEHHSKCWWGCEDGKKNPEVWAKVDNSENLTV